MLCLFFFVSCKVYYSSVLNYFFVQRFIDIAKKQARRKRKQDNSSKNDSLHDDKVASDARTSSIATKLAKKKAKSKKLEKKMTDAKCFHILFSMLLCYLFFFSQIHCPHLLKVKWAASPDLNNLQKLLEKE